MRFDLICFIRIILWFKLTLKASDWKLVSRICTMKIDATKQADAGDILIKLRWATIDVAKVGLKKLLFINRSSQPMIEALSAFDCGSAGENVCSLYFIEINAHLYCIKKRNWIRGYKAKYISLLRENRFHISYLRSKIHFWTSSDLRAIWFLL